MHLRMRTPTKKGIHNTISDILQPVQLYKNRLSSVIEFGDTQQDNVDNDRGRLNVLVCWDVHQFCV